MSARQSNPPEHFNPPPMFGLREWWPDVIETDDYDGDGWCIECGDEFHLDDVGGYNPPCSCGLHCRSCHEAEMYDRDEDDYDEYEMHRAIMESETGR